MLTAVRKRKTSVGTNADATVFFFETELGWMALAWREDALARLSFGHPSLSAAMKDARSWPDEVGSTDVKQEDELPGWVRRVVKRLTRFAAGTDDDFSDISVDLSHLTEFQRNVVDACRAIPAGQTRSYGELAEQAGSPRAARAVGNVMRGNRYPLIIPCHRVVGSNGRLCGFTCPQGTAMKERLLAREHEAASR